MVMGTYGKATSGNSVKKYGILPFPITEGYENVRQGNIRKFGEEIRNIAVSHSLRLWESLGKNLPCGKLTLDGKQVCRVTISLG